MTDVCLSLSSSQDSPHQKSFGPAVIRIGSNSTMKEGKKVTTISSPKKDAHHTIQSSPAHRLAISAHYPVRIKVS